MRVCIEGSHFAAGCSALRNCLSVGPDHAVVYASGSNAVFQTADRISPAIVAGGGAGMVRGTLVVPHNGSSRWMVVATSSGSLQAFTVDGALVDSVAFGAGAVMHVAAAAGEDGTDAAGTVLVAATADGNIYGVDFEMGVFSNTRVLYEIPASLLVTALAAVQVCLSSTSSANTGSRADAYTAADTDRGAGSGGNGSRENGGAESRLVVFAGISDNSVSVIVPGHECHTLVGHLNWIHSLSIHRGAHGLWLASGSSDRTVRVWHFSRSSPLRDDAPGSVNGDAVKGGARGMAELIPRSQSIRSLSWEISCRAIHYGHEAAVQCVSWVARPHPTVCGANAAGHTGPENGSASNGVCASSLAGLGGGESGADLVLASCALDQSVILWPATGGSRLAQISPDAAVESNTVLGYFSCAAALLPSKRYQVTCSGSTGSIVRCTMDLDGSNVESKLLASGHLGGFISGCSWHPAGRHLLSVSSSDRTTRLWAPHGGAWVEDARPQIHGYDLHSVAALAAGLISAADEKILRVFAEPAAAGSAVLQPALGLSNKRCASDEHAPAAGRGERSEELLRGGSLWPETDKLYGHGMEVNAIALAPCATWCASASKASVPLDAGIRLWRDCTAAGDGASGTRWKAAACATIDAGHHSTVLCMQFSPCSGRFLLAGSRDRTWSLTDLDAVFAADRSCAESHPPGMHNAALAAAAVGGGVCNGVLDGAVVGGGLAGTAVRTIRREWHRRAVWAVAWGLDERQFYTGSRDQTVCQWSCADTSSPVATLRLPASVTALSVGRIVAGGEGILAVGLEDGTLHFYTPTLGPIAVTSGPVANAHDRPAKQRGADSEVGEPLCKEAKLEPAGGLAAIVPLSGPIRDIKWHPTVPGVVAVCSDIITWLAVAMESSD